MWYDTLTLFLGNTKKQNEEEEKGDQNQTDEKIK